MRGLLRVGAALVVAAAVFFTVSAPAAATTLPASGTVTWTVYAAGAPGTATMSWHRDAASGDYLEFVVSVRALSRLKSLWYAGRGPISVVQAPSDVPAVQRTKAFTSTAALKSFFQARLHFSKALTPMLGMKETGGGSAVCTGVDSGAGKPSATCSSIDLFGSELLVPGRTQKIITLTITNTGVLPASTFTLRPGACTQSASFAPSGRATDICARAHLSIMTATTVVFRGMLTDLTARGTVPLAPLPAGATRTYRFWLTLDPSADNSYQGLALRMPFTWTFNS
ncbi:hypothetical protein QDR37_09305 [Amnibacterium sp. CER49]|uniref:hypothetical protein n=1 Tax=Amnibacterium sp. CER49 TaxID=3039161 RepID=UPI002447705A|nr:hypothetical protein [Amnibacterium sp. CER49]MDH2444140.1 hypothetical protein [Amnibacterium sp. CER49]